MSSNSVMKFVTDQTSYDITTAGVDVNTNTNSLHVVGWTTAPCIVCVGVCSDIEFIIDIATHACTSTMTSSSDSKFKHKVQCIVYSYLKFKFSVWDNV